MDHIVYLALGSNLGNRLANLKNAVSNLTPQTKVKKKSPVYETPPWGDTEQPMFLNMAVKVETYLDPENLLAHLKRLETALGRVPNHQNGPRLIDIDILFYDDIAFSTPSIVIPHPRLYERGFVLVPLNDIAPNHVHPELRKTVKEMMLQVSRKDIKLYEGK